MSLLSQLQKENTNKSHAGHVSNNAVVASDPDGPGPEAFRRGDHKVWELRLSSVNPGLNFQAGRVTRRSWLQFGPLVSQKS